VPLTPNPTVHIAGWLCGVGSLEGKTVQLLVHGAAESHLYWDWPAEPERYSYVRSLTGAGYAVFNFDRLGTGESDHPAALDVTVPVHGRIIHELVQSLHRGDIGGVRFNRVVLVGHSYGSALTVFEAANYRDVDALVVTAPLEVPGSGYARFFASLYPAELDPRFAGSLPSGYLTTRPGALRLYYFDPAPLDEKVVSLAESYKETFTVGEAAEYPLTQVSRLVRVPVLAVFGEFDPWTCDLPCGGPLSLASLETTFWAPETCFEQSVVPGAGHAINLFPHAPDAFAAIRNWLDRRVGISGAPSDPCRA
jgi:pimeloyl-ACP methyl ester carboxylesterase